MAQTKHIRDFGSIPEKRHDAFLLALLLAVSLNVLFFALQALIPRLAGLLQMFGPQPVQALQEEEEAFPFVLVDPASLEEDDPEQVPEAEANVSRRAAQAEPAPEALPEERTYQEEGVDEILTAPDGNPGENVSYQQVPGEVPAPTPGVPAEPVPEAEPAEEAEEAAEPVEPVEPIEPVEPVEPTEPAEPIEPVEPVEPLPEMPPPLPELPEMEAPETEPVEPPQPEESVEPEPLPELPQLEPPPEADPEDPLPELPELEEPPPEPAEEPAEEMPELAALPVSPEGFLDPQTAELREVLARPSPPARPQPIPPAPARPAVQPTQQAVQSAQQPREVTEATEAREAREGREGRRQPTFRRIGGAAPAGGTPPRRNTSSRIRVLDSDPTMRLLAHRYGEYMEAVARQLQESLNRVVMLSPLEYTRGSARIRFGIAPDGSLSYFETEYPADGPLVNVRLTSEQMLREAAPFGPPTAEMLADPNFQQMSVTVFLE